MERHEIIADDGTRLAFGLTGPDTGTAVLLCHGLCASGAQFAADAAWFSQHGLRVIVPDLRGHGRSGMPAHIRPEAFAPARLLADVNQMLDSAGIGWVHWVGNSLGGIVGLGASASAPERLLSLTLFGTALALDLPPLGWALPALDRFPGRALAARLTAHNTTSHRASRPLIQDMLMQYDARAAAGIVRHIRRYDLLAEARNWAGAGLVQVGGQDRAVNRALMPQLAALAGRENWRIEHLPAGGHCANLDASAAWRQAILSLVSGA